MPTITQLEYLLAINEARHFGKAAKLCHVSQPSLSAQIQKLEDELDVVIFDRSKKPIMTTEAGKDIISQAKIVVKEHRKIATIANQGGHDPRGDFHLAVIPTLAPYLIPMFVADFAKRYPNVRLKIDEHKTDDIIRLLHNDELDAGLLVTPLGEDGLIERHLFLEPFFCFVSKQNRLATKKLISEQDLDHEELWLLQEGHCFREQVLKICSRDHKSAVLKNVEFAGGSLETLKNLVKKSAGYTLLPELAVRELAESEVKDFVRAFKKPVPTREVSIVHSRSFLKENSIKALEETILDNLPKSIRSLKRQNADVIGLY
jgi:LysR family hydrogen peroxide-inducible transcriptional activator